MRSLLPYRLRSPTFAPLKTKEWRAIAGLEAHITHSGTHTNTSRTDLENMLKECLVSGKMQASFDIEKLDAAPVEWRGEQYNQNSTPPTRVVQEFLWELFEVNFRYELLALDRLCNTTTTSKGEREIEVLGMINHFNSSLVPSDHSSSMYGFASKDLVNRRHALRGLYTVMEGWQGEKFALPRSLVEGSSCVKVWEREVVTEMELRQYEKALLTHYISTFATTFGRAPLLPHGL
ncbi:hypothetical protein PQX77_002962 [Marasmius sp. AFHP31]|nr:hypothetical protein PQX77_002962 [Marasmius sp. AFHP31]